jgi:hypothetical protein
LGGFLFSRPDSTGTPSALNGPSSEREGDAK